MSLTLAQIKERLKKPVNKSLISEARKHELRIRFHVETALQASDIQEACNEFFEWVKKVITNKEKYRLFLSLFRFPIVTTETTEQIFNALKKVFDGRDPYNETQFVNTDNEKDWEDYFNTKLGGRSRFNSKAFDACRTAPNSVIIVDAKRLEKDEEGNYVSPEFIPEPYYYFKDISTFHDLAYNKESEKIEYVMFIVGHELFVYDDEYYRVFRLNEDKNEITAELVNVEHELEECPAKFHIRESITSTKPIIKKSILSNQLSNLDRLALKHTNKEHLDLFAAYPIYYGVEVACDYKNVLNGDFCDGGFIKDKMHKYMIDGTGAVTQCPVCASKRFAGPGTFIETPYPDKENGIEGVANPVGIVSVDVESLNYNAKVVAELKAEIYTNCVGYAGDMPNDQAVNKLQVVASFESREAVLTEFKKDIEESSAWTESMMCKLRYSDFISCTRNLGTEWYLSNVSDLVRKYNEAKTAGAHDSELDSLQDQIMETEHRNNPYALQRAQILVHLEPFRHMTRNEVIANSSNISQFNPTEVAIKVNFSNFITRFERENTSVVEFGSLLPFYEKINIIKQTLQSYVKETAAA